MSSITHWDLYIISRRYNLTSPICLLKVPQQITCKTKLIINNSEMFSYTKMSRHVNLAPTQSEPRGFETSPVITELNPINFNGILLLDLCVSVMFVGVNTDGTHALRPDELPILRSCDSDWCLYTEILSIHSHVDTLCSFPYMRRVIVM